MWSQRVTTLRSHKTAAECRRLLHPLNVVPRSEIMEIVQEDKQVKNGFWHLFSSLSFVWELNEETVPVELRISSVLVLKKRYSVLCE